jgi:hypothetical protein
MNLHSNVHLPHVRKFLVFKNKAVAQRVSVLPYEGIALDRARWAKFRRRTEA